jgi:hypothetical protein
MHEMASGPSAVGILWRGDRDSPYAARLQPVFAALGAAGIVADAVPFDDETADAVREQLLRLAGVLVWVDPVMGDRDRTVLDALLREVAGRGVWVSAHPDVVLELGTKEILVRTRGLSCGSDAYAYRALDEFRSAFPSRLADGARVLKRHRGNAGIGVWKVQLADGAAAGADPLVDVQDAHSRGTAVETMRLSQLIERLATCFAAGGMLIDQPFEPRIAEGLVRCYVVRNEVAGFATQEPDPAAVATGRVFGLPSKKTMYAASEERFAPLRHDFESEWLGAIQQLTGVETARLPLLWDADFLYAEQHEPGRDRFVLCEINASCVIPFPPAAPAQIARAVADRLEMS